MPETELYLELGGLKQSMTNVEAAVEKLITKVDALAGEVAELKLREARRSTIEKVAMWISGVFGAGSAIVLEHLWK
ncbi:MAG TPA: hypothetical protein VFF98_14845 [Novosphingobium sp.]|nr:hypothetical protein [Novosphingobium sp.]HZV11482.1 hypothetical protein [Novosphingobium sp.]